MKRYLEEQIVKDLNSKMLFLAGPRQCGKTTLAKQILHNQTENKLKTNIVPTK